MLLVAAGHERSPAAASLERAALVAAEAPAGAGSSGAYAYSEAVGFELASGVGSGPRGTTGGRERPYSVYGSFVRSSWVAADGSGRAEQAYGSWAFPSPSDRAAWRADGSPGAGGRPAALSELSWTEGPGEIYPVLAASARSRRALLGELEAGKLAPGSRGTAEVVGPELFPGRAGELEDLGQLLAGAPIAPEARSSLFSVAARLPGVYFLGRVSDLLGRRAAAVAVSSGGVRDELLFDPASAAVLGQEAIVVDPAESCRLEVPTGSVIYDVAYPSSAPVATEATLPAEATLPSRGTLPAPGGSGGARSPALRIELPVSGAAPSCASVGVHRR